MKPYFGLTGGWLTFWVSVACSTDMALFGYDQGVFSGVNVSNNYLNLMGFSPTSSLLSTVTAIYDVGSFFGALLAFDLGERLGRKKTILLGTSIMTVGGILQISAFSPAQMLVARIISGIGNGLNTATAPVWQAETSKASMRGKLVVIEMVLNIAGFSLSNWLNYGFSFLSGSIVWRLPIAFQLVFIFILFATVPWLPESPRWLVSHGRIEEAEQIIADLEALPLDDPWVITQSEEVQYAAKIERENSVPFRDLLRGRTGNQKGTCVIRRLLLGAGTQAMQQLSGINVTSYYLPTVLTQSVGLAPGMARLIAACNSVSYLFFGSLGIPCVERWGRRSLMMLGAAGQCFCYLIITVLIRYSKKPDFPESSQTMVAEASVAFFFLYYVFFGFGWQGVPWLYPTEINSLGMRTRGAAIGTATNWIFNFMVVEITPIGIGSLHWKFYIIWTIFNAAFIPIVYFLYPETAGRSLEDMDRFFTEDPPLLAVRDRDAVRSKRPAKYIDLEEAEYRRNSSVASSTAAARAAAKVYGARDAKDPVGAANNSSGSPGGSEVEDVAEKRAL